MRRGPRLRPVVLTCNEQVTLERWTRRPTTAQALALRARIVLGAARGESNSDLARRLTMTRPTVVKWGRRFVRDRLAGLLDEPRQITDADVVRVLTMT